MRQYRKSTIKDVAARAGVSTATVSYFVGGREGVCSVETAQRIRAAVSELHYTPSSLTGGLRRRSTMSLGLNMLSPHDPGAIDGSFFLERLWRGIASQADVEDYSVLHYPASVRSGVSCDPYLDGRVDGVLFHPPHMDIRPARTAAAGMPTVVLTRSQDLPDGCGAAYADETQAVDLALSHLRSLGHRRIAHIAGPVGLLPPGPGQRPPQDIAVWRLESYSAWMAAHDAFDQTLIGPAEDWTGQHVPEIIAAWHRRSSPPTAILCANDALAIAALSAAQTLGWRVPQDLSVVGMDNSPQSRDSSPPLTSVDVPVEEVGREAVRALLRLMQGTPVERCRVAVPVTTLAVRRSTGPPPRGPRHG